MKNNTIFSLMISILTGLLLIGCSSGAQPSQATPIPQLQAYLNVNRLVGYSSGGAEIKGQFRMSVIGVENIQSVDFLIDDAIVATIIVEPYRFDFRTEDYPTGERALSATVTTSDGRTVALPARHLVFISAEQEQKAISQFIIPLFTGIVVVMAIGVTLQMLVLKKKGNKVVPLGAERDYGVLGGGICPRCKRPFPVHIWGVNMLVGKLDRCDFCGKWSLIRRQPLDALRAAETAEVVATQQPAEKTIEKSEDEKLKEMLDESKYTKQHFF